MLFHTTLQSLRENAGYGSARAFFLKCGGLRAFGCTYKQYRNAEAGRSVPSPKLADRIAAALCLEATPDAARRFMESYLRLLLGSERLVNLALGPGTRAIPTPLETALTKGAEKSKHMPSAGTEFLLKTPENFWAYLILSNDSSSWSPQDISRISGLPAPKLRQALEKLRKHKLAVKTRDGRWRAPLIDVMAAPAEKDLPRLHAQVDKHLGVDRGRGEVTVHHHVVLRASAAHMAQFKPLLHKALNGVGLFATTEAGPDTGLYVVTGTVRRLTAF